MGTCLLSTCVESSPETALTRSQRFGIFRDLVLFARPAEDGGPFFLDRFESTREDFRVWRGEPPEESPDLRPAAGVDLLTARRFARWRFCRLPRAEEWRHVATQGGRYIFPWGDTLQGTEANTGRLGLGEPTPVGSFAPGRQDGPFDLVGNVAEWTETVVDPEQGTPVPYVRVVERDVLVDRVVGLPEWPSFVANVDGENYPYEQTGAMPLGLRVWLPLWTPMPAAWLSIDPPNRVGEFEFSEQQEDRREIDLLEMPGIEEYQHTPGLTCWLPDWCLAPTDWLVAAATDRLERLVVGGHYRSLMPVDTDGDKLPRTRQWLPLRRGPGTGVRLATDPCSLLVALLIDDRKDAAGAAAEGTLLRFLRDPAHRPWLEAAWPFAVREAAGRGGWLAPLLRAEFGEPDA